jgi:hypothetical protein
MPAFETIAGGVTTVGGTPTAITMASGDTLGVRNFPDASAGWLENITLHGAVQANIRSARVRSPRMHDNVTGLTFTPGELLSAYAFPAQTRQRLYAADTLIAEINGGAAAEFQELALHIYYDQLPASNADLRSWSDIGPNVISYKSFEVVLGAAAANVWSDTVITTTDNQLHASSAYAVLGYETNTLMTAVGIKGIATGNLRAGGPGQNSDFPTSEWFVRMSDKHGVPHIPVFQANDRAAMFISAISRVAIAGTERATLVCAEVPKT